MTTTIQTATSPSAGGSTAAETAGRLRAIITELGQEYLERTEVIHGLVTAMLCREHVLLLGPPGTAKSALARAVLSRVDNATASDHLLTPFTSPTSIFGPIDVGKLMQGTYTQAFSGRASEAHFAFLDELFNANAALTELLAFLADRIYHPESGGPPRACPLVTAVAASNQPPGAEHGSVGEAIYDRLLIRYEVGYLQEPSSVHALLRRAAATPPPGTPPAARTTVGLAELEDATRTQVPAVTVGEWATEALDQLWAQLAREGVTVSDRRWVKTVRVLQAAAWLAGRDHVAEADLEILIHVLWGRAEDRPVVQREVLSVANPGAQEALDIAETIGRFRVELDGLTGADDTERRNWAWEVTPKLKAAFEQLTGLRTRAEAAGRSTTAITEALDAHQHLQTRIVREVLGMDGLGLGAGALQPATPWAPGTNR